MIYTLDTNVFVDALRQPGELEPLSDFLRWAATLTVLSSVVATELAAGASTDRSRRLLEDGVLAPFARRNRIAAPSEAAWRRAGSVLAATNTGRVSASCQNDVLLAAQARESGWTVVTRDQDFHALRLQVAGLQVVAPFPDRPA